MLVGDQYFQLILCTRLVIHDRLNLLKRALYSRRLLTVFIGKLLEGKLIHLLLDQHQDLVDLLDKIHLLDHLPLLDLLELHLLLDLPDLPLLVQLYLRILIDLLGLPPLVPVQMQQVQFSKGISPFLDLIAGGQMPGDEFNMILVDELELILFQSHLISSFYRNYSSKRRISPISCLISFKFMYCWSGRKANYSP